MIYHEFAENLLDQIEFTKQIKSFFEDQRKNAESNEQKKHYASKIKMSAECITNLELTYSIASDEHEKETTEEMDSALKAVQDCNDRVKGQVSNVTEGINALFFIAQLVAVCIAL